MNIIVEIPQVEDWQSYIAEIRNRTIEDIIEHGKRIYQFSLSCETVKGGSKFSESMKEWFGMDKSLSSQWKIIGEHASELSDNDRNLPTDVRSIVALISADALTEARRDMKRPEVRKIAKAKKASKKKYSGYVVAFEEGVIKSISSGVAGRLKAKMSNLYPDIDLFDPNDEQRLRSACKELFAQENPTIAAENVEKIKASLTEKQRGGFEKRFADAVTYQTHCNIIEKIDAAFAEERARLDAKESELNEWMKTLDAREADVTNYMTEQEFKIVLGCLHPDRAGGDDVLRKRLDRAFDIFRRLESYIRKYPVSVMRSRGWA